jgi:hypothetical protein
MRYQPSWKQSGDRDHPSRCQQKSVKRVHSGLTAGRTGIRTRGPYDNIERLELSVDQILPLHGRKVPLAELQKWIGKSS